jgi:hypothetical protein
MIEALHMHVWKQNDETVNLFKSEAEYIRKSNRGGEFDKLNKTKYWFLEKMNKINKPWALKLQAHNHHPWLHLSKCNKWKQI